MKKILTCILMLAPMCLFAQYGETIRTGRPGQAIGGFALGKSVFQMQTGYNFNQRNVGETETFITSNTTVLRLGVTEKIELSGLINWQTESYTFEGQNAGNSGGVSNTQFGGRINLSENDGWVPTIGFQARVLLKFQSEIYERDELGTKFVLATGNRINDRFSLTTNWAVSWLGNGQNPISLYVVNCSYSINDKFGTFGECYGRLDDFSANFDTGLSYLVNKDFQLDASVGWQGEEGVTDWFVDVGISWRFDWRDK